MPSATPSPAWDGRRPATGTEPGAAALLGWLTDPDAPRLCLVTGAPGSGKTALLGWLAAHGPRSGRPRRRPARVLVPLAGQCALGAAWTVADRLGVVAGTPGDLVDALATSEARPAGRVVLLLTDLHAAAEPDALARLVTDLAGWAGSGSWSRPATTPPPSRPCAPTAGSPSSTSTAAPALDPAGEPARPLPDLSDPAAVCAADPLLVTTAYVTGSAPAGVPGTLDGPEPSGRPGETVADDHGGLRTAWMRAGQSLCRAQPPAERALVLLAALGDGADPRLRPTLAGLAAAAPWRLRWARHRGDLTPPWPGPVTVLGSAGGPWRAPCSWATAPAPYACCTRPTRAPPDAWRTPSPAGSRPSRPPRTARCCSSTTGAGCTPCGERLPGPVPGAPHRGGLRDPRPSPRHRPRGDRRFGGGGGPARFRARLRPHRPPPGGLPQRSGHGGRGGGVRNPFVCSGGADGTVRLWTPGRDPVPEPLAERRSPVVSLHAAETPHGPLVAAAWADGLVELHRPEGGPKLSFRPGPRSAPSPSPARAPSSSAPTRASSASRRRGDEVMR